MGRTVDFGGGFSTGGARIGAARRGWIGWTGVPKAGEEEGMGLTGMAEGFSGRLAVAIVVVDYGNDCHLHALYGASTRFTVSR